MRTVTCLGISLVAAAAIAGGFKLGEHREEVADRTEREPVPRTDEQCANQEFSLVAPDGSREGVPQKFVVSAVTDKGYRFPGEAQRIFMAKDGSSSGPCVDDGSAPVDAAAGLFRRGFKFRGWRKLTIAERKEAATAKKFGEPER